MLLGFTLPNNQYDIFLVSFGVRDSDKLKEQKTKILTDHKLPAYEILLVISR
jgi:hypothetical protein